MSDLLDALRSGDIEEIWEGYKEAWDNNERPAMTESTFCELFYDGDKAKEAVELVKESDNARSTISRAALTVSASELNDSDRRSVFEAALEQEIPIAFWEEERLDFTAERRSNLARNAASALVRLYGRARARAIVSEKWSTVELLEEEKEGLLIGLSSQLALTEEYLYSLGSDAISLAQRLSIRVKLENQSEYCYSNSAITLGASLQPGTYDRIQCLIRPLKIDADLRDSCLRIEEFEKVVRPIWPRAMLTHESLFNHFRREMPGRIADSLASAIFMTSGQLYATNGQKEISFPLIRLLHLRLILEAPSLSKAIRTPIEYLIPEVLLYMFERDGALYHPHLRVLRDADRRWLARWTESMGEALSVAFMEDALGLALPTLSRIPEKPDCETPDFMASTHRDEKLVFESKGSRDWRTHLSQRRKALNQLGKVRGGKNPKGLEVIDADGEGRAFACCLYTAEQGCQRDSLFHVDDPAFSFGHLFHQGWDDWARRNHFAAVLQSFGEHELAESIIGRGGLSEEKRRRPRERRKSDLQTFRVKAEADSDSGDRFVGRYISISEVGRRIGLLNARKYDNIKMFTGMNARFYETLSRMQIPYKEPENEREAVQRKFGALPSKNGNYRGVFSQMADGAFLAIEIDEG